MDSGDKISHTIPNPGHLDKSLTDMTDSQIQLNIVQIHLLALENEEVSEWLANKMTDINFFLQYRHLLPNLLNGQFPPTIQKRLNSAVSKFDQRFINGEEGQPESEKTIMKKPFKKARRLNLSSRQAQLCQILDFVSGDLMQYEDGAQKREMFDKGLTESNVVLSKQEEKQTSSSDSEGDAEGKGKGVEFVVDGKLTRLTSIEPKQSYPIRTKNRHPLVLNCNFGKFLYKNDDQLSHELISMQWVEYLNDLFGKEYIVPYQIIPMQKGAFYRFIQNSLTVHQIKGLNQGKITPYLAALCQTHGEETILNRFAETYSGFCILQYLLDIKDRNNANIMIREDGSIFHIDMTFIFGSGPGGISFESAPWKMPKEYVKSMGGFESDYFKRYETLMVQHLTKIFQRKDQLFYKAELLSRKAKAIKCFDSFKMNNFRHKFPNKLEKVKAVVEELIDKSYDNWKTTKYDDYQFKTNGLNK